MTKINFTLENQNELNEILNEVSKKAKELQKAITRLEQFEIKISVSLLQMKVEEKAELMKLTDIDFEERLHQMAVDFRNDGVIRV